MNDMNTEPMENAAVTEKLQLRIQAAKVKFVDSLSEKIFTLDQLLQFLDKPKSQEVVMKEIRTIVHRIHGAAGMFGFARMGSLACQLESIIDKVFVTSPPFNTKVVSELLDALLVEMELAFDSD
jgi:chemotaxis protein histidine kinase CheA